MIKNFKLALIALLWTSVAFAQQSNMQRFIDGDQVVFVMKMQPNMTYNKFDKESKDKYKVNELMAPMLIQFAGGEASEEQVKKISSQLADPGKAGVNVREDIYIWGQRPTTRNSELYTDKDMNVMMINVVIPVTDNKKFKNFLDGLMSNESQQKVITAGGNSTMLSNEMIITWNSKRVIIAGTTMEYSFFEDREEFDTRRDKALLQHALDLNKVNSKKSLEGNKAYQASIVKDADMNFWADYGKLAANADMVPMQMRSIIKSLSKLTENTMLSGQGYFKGGEAGIKTNMSLNSTMKRVTDAAYSRGSINKKFYKYIDKTNLMGLYSFSMDLKGFMMTYGQEIHRVLKEQDTKETRVMMNMMDIVDIFLDEEETYKILTGDMMFALTDMRVINRKKSDFKYNEESNSWEEETEIVEEVMPIFNLMMGCGNEANIRHFIDLGVNMGGLEKQQEGVWAVPEVKENTGVDFYIILKDGLLIMTNDDQIAKNLNGFPATKQLPLASVTKMSGYVMYGMLDATQISRVAKEAYANQEEGVPNKIMELEKIFSKIEFTSMPPTGKDFKSDLYFHMRDEKTNALQFLLENVETLMSGYKSGSSEGSQPEIREDEEDGVKRL